MVFGQPHRVVAALVHDGKAFQRAFIDRIQRHRAIAPAEELQDANVHVSPRLACRLVSATHCTGNQGGVTWNCEARSRWSPAAMAGWGSAYAMLWRRKVCTSPSCTRRAATRQ